MAALSAGVLVVNVDGQIFEVEGDFSVQPNATSREMVVAESGKPFTKTTPIVPTIKGSMLVTAETTPAWYAAIVDKPMSVRLRDGRVYAADSVTSSGTYEHDVIGGKVPVEFYASAAIRCSA